ncbi:MAG: hypothetical protein AAGM84_01930 [Pseudomonadota bacterium]
MRARKLSTVLVLALGLAVPAAAQNVMYDCQITKGGEAGTWIGTRLALIVEESGAARAVDNVTITFVEGGSAAARLTRRGDTLRFSWNVAGASDSRQQNIPTFTYTANLNTGTGAVRVRAKPVRFPQSWSGSGTCTPRSDMSVRELNRLLRG